ncbi:MAG: polyketide cyclase [Methyloglobulus sp.]|nr:polyketide cyclase [Methyloglobulus sp.]
MKIQNVPIATTAMLIRKPVSDVFEAFVNPAITAKFWFTKGSSRLQVGKKIHWDWEMYNVSVQVSVKAIEDNKRILIEWGSVGEKPTTVEWVFTSRSDNTTFVSVTNSGFSGDGDDLVSQALDSTGGFALVLAGAKAWLEHGINLNLIADRFPEGH